MTIDDCYKFVQFVSNKVQNGNISPDQFNLLAPIMQLSVINQLLGNEQEYKPGMPMPRYGLGINQKIQEDLRPIIQGPIALTYTSGSAPYPNDCLYIYELYWGSNVEIKMTEIDEYRILINSVIKPPTTQFPIATVLGNTIYFVPSSITAPNINYVRKPTTPVWNFTIVNDVPVYNPSGSQDFELSPLIQLRICAKILAAVGVNLSQQEVQLYSAAMEASGA